MAAATAVAGAGAGAPGAVCDDPVTETDAKVKKVWTTAQIRLYTLGIASTIAATLVAIISMGVKPALIVAALLALGIGCIVYANTETKLDPVNSKHARGHITDPHL